MQQPSDQPDQPYPGPPIDLENLPGFRECLAIARSEGFGEEAALVLAMWTVVVAHSM